MVLFLKIAATIMTVSGIVLASLHVDWLEEKNLKSRNACYIGIALLTLGAYLGYFSFDSAVRVIFVGGAAFIAFLVLLFYFTGKVPDEQKRTRNDEGAGRSGIASCRSAGKLLLSRYA